MIINLFFNRQATASVARFGETAIKLFGKGRFHHLLESKNPIPYLKAK